jgi:hypothetical protein
VKSKGKIEPVLNNFRTKNPEVITVDCVFKQFNKNTDEIPMIKSSHQPKMIRQLADGDSM